MQLPQQKAHPSHQALAAALCKAKHGQIYHQALPADSLAEFRLWRVRLQGVVDVACATTAAAAHRIVTGLLKAECYITQHPCLA